MALIRWNPFGDLNAIQRQMHHMFDETENESHFLRAWSPAVDVLETEDKFEVTAELPGLDQKEITVNVENDVMTISGERKFESEDSRDDYTRVERTYGSFRRSFTLPPTVDQTKIKAKMEKGLLNVTLPKREETKPKQIEVKVN